jgi:hypothetical protein
MLESILDQTVKNRSLKLVLMGLVVLVMVAFAVWSSLPESQKEKILGLDAPVAIALPKTTPDLEPKPEPEPEPKVKPVPSPSALLTQATASDFVLTNSLHGSDKAKYNGQSLLDNNEQTYWLLPEHFIKNQFTVTLTFKQPWRIAYAEIMRPAGIDIGSYIKGISVRAQLANGGMLPEKEYTLAQDTGLYYLPMEITKPVKKIELTILSHWGHWQFVMGDIHVYGYP